MGNKSHIQNKLGENNDSFNKGQNKEKTWKNKLGKIIAKTLVDEEFRQQLINNPKANLKEAGIE